MVSKKRTLLCLLFLSTSLPLFAQWEVSGNKVYTENTFVGIGISNPKYALEVKGDQHIRGKVEFVDPVKGYNGDRVAFFRQDPRNDFASLRLSLGDENKGEFLIGYTDYATNQFMPTLNIQADNKIYFGNGKHSSRLIGQIGHGRSFGFHISRWAGKFSWTIGSSNGDYSLMVLERRDDGKVSMSVNGSLRANQMKVNLDHAAPDYVFHKDYNLRPLSEVESFINQHHHLPEIPPGKTLETEGINIADMEMSLLKKVEELTLYVIELQKEIEQLKKKNE